MIGGSCINVACIPTKTLIASARVARTARLAATFGVQAGEVRVDWPAVRSRAEGVVTAMRLARSPQLLMREDPDVTEALAALLREDGIALELGAEVSSLMRR